MHLKFSSPVCTPEKLHENHKINEIKKDRSTGCLVSFFFQTDQRARKDDFLMIFDVEVVEKVWTFGVITLVAYLSPKLKSVELQFVLAPKKPSQFREKTPVL